MTAEPAERSLPGPADFSRFYAPLAATSLLLTVTNPLLAAALARTPDPAAALAGYGVAFALTGVLYSPALVFQQVAAARLLKGYPLAPVRHLALLTGIVLSLMSAAVSFTSLGGVVLSGAIGIHGTVFEEATSAMAFLWPVPLLTALRALHQGRLVAGHRTTPIAVATGLRTMVLALIAFALTAAAAGAWLGGAAFTGGLLVEAAIVATRRTPPAPGRGAGATGERAVAPPHRAGYDDGTATATPAGWRTRHTAERGLVMFAMPLMLNTLLWWSTPLFISAVLARTPEPDCSLAAFTVVEAIAWFVTAPVGQLQQAGIALVHERRGYVRVRLMAGGLALLAMGVLAVVSLPGVRETLLWSVFRLDPSLLEPAGMALPIAALYPLLYGHRQYHQGLFVRAGCSELVGRGAVLRIVVIVAAAPLLLGPMGDNGARLGVALAVLGLAAEGVFLEILSRARALPRLDAAQTGA